MTLLHLNVYQLTINWFAALRSGLMGLEMFEQTDLGLGHRSIPPRWTRRASWRCFRLERRHAIYSIRWTMALTDSDTELVTPYDHRGDAAPEYTL